MEAAAADAHKRAQEAAALAERRRSDEARRFIDAMRAQALERIQERGIQLPPLCACPGTNADILGPHWETCANNCVFYRNPAVSRAGKKLCVVW